MKPAILLVLTILGGLGCGGARIDPDSGMRAKLATHREQQIQRLHDYAALGQFPHNVTSPANLHIFRDAEGRYCAVANLVHQDGRDDLVEGIVKDHNDLAIHDVTDGPLMAWIAESGLTKEELERIQFPSEPFTRLDRPPMPQLPPVKVPSPDELIALTAPLRSTVNVVDDDALKAHVRAHLAKMESELRAGSDASLALAVARSHEPHDQRIASR